MWIDITDEFALVLKSELHAKLMLSDPLDSEAYLAVEVSATAEHAGLIHRIDDFCTRLGLACDSRTVNQNNVVVSIGINDSMNITNASMLLGSFLILQRGYPVDDVIAAFHSLSDRFVLIMDSSSYNTESIVTVHDCWRALDHALHLGWLVPRTSDDEPALDVGELARYAALARYVLYEDGSVS